MQIHSSSSFTGVGIGMKEDIDGTSMYFDAEQENILVSSIRTGIIKTATTTTGVVVRYGT
jgi:hypothetical protein